jgi:glycosyltransferase involved in cell wall biosynthesis
VATDFRRRQTDFDILIANSLAGWAVPDFPGITVYHGTRAGYADIVNLRGLSDIKARFAIGYFERRSGQRRIVVAVSESARQEVERHYRLRVDAVIKNGIDIDQFRPRKDRVSLRRKFGLPTDRFIALFTGRPSYHKGTDILDAIARHLPPDIAIIAAVPVGYQSNQRIHQVVGLSRTELAELYSASDAFVFPSRWEACSQSLSEALATGLPPVASRVGSMSDLLAAEPTVAQVSPASSDPLDYVNHLVGLRNKPALVEQISAICRAFAEAEHSRDVMVARYLAILERAGAARVIGRAKYGQVGPGMQS